MSIYAGIFNATKNPPELNSRSFAGTMLRRFPGGTAPLFGMTSMLKDGQAKATTHGYFTKTMEFSRITMAAAGLSTDTTLTVTDTQGIVAGMIVHNATTGENIRIISVVSATSVTVTRAVGRIAAAAIASGAVLVVVGNAHEEGSPRPTARSIQAVYASNFTQIFRNAWALTDTARASYAEQGYSNIAESKQDCMNFHATDIESALFWGQAHMSVYNGQPLHTTQGIIDAIRQYAPENVHVAGATTSYDDLRDYTNTAFQNQTSLGESRTRAVFCDSLAMDVLVGIGEEYGERTATQSETSYGMVFTSFRTRHGVMNLIEHPLFNGLNVQPGIAVGVDLPGIRMAYLGDRKQKAENYGVGGSNSMGDGVDAQGGSLTTEFALEMVNPPANFVITGLTAAAKRVQLTQTVTP